MNETQNLDSQPISTPAKLGIILAVVAVLALFAGSIYYLLQESTPTEQIRDILLIVMSVELLIIGFTAALLILQIARLANFFQSEIKPVLDAANETMSTVRGTAEFLSDSVVQPAIKINSYFSGFRRMLELLNIKF